MNCIGIHTLLWGMSKLESLWVNGKTLVLGNSHLVISFSKWRACPFKLELFYATNEIAAIWQGLDGVVMFCHVGQKENQLADWLTNVARSV